MVISAATIFVFLDIFAPFTAPFGIALALLASRCAVTYEDRKRAWMALALAFGTVLLFVLLIPMYDAMNAGL